MGSSCRVVAPNAEYTCHAVGLVDQLERSWSRFLPDSEVSALNECAGHITVVSAVTYELIATAERARRATAGAFTPLMLDQLVELGYDRTWTEVQLSGIDADEDVVTTNHPACDVGIELYPEIHAVRLPDGVRFDPGGIGKGLAADMVAAALVDAGATSAQVELGGDVRVAGPAWNGGDWEVRVDDADHGAPVAATIRVPEGGVATSSTMRRRWRRGGVDVHHLLDPRTGRPAETDLDAVTAVAPSLWWAEVVAKVALMAGSDGARRILEHHGMSGVLVRATAHDRYEVVERAVVPA